MNVKLRTRNIVLSSEDQPQRLSVRVDFGEHGQRMTRERGHFSLRYWAIYEEISLLRIE